MNSDDRFTAAPIIDLHEGGNADNSKENACSKIGGSVLWDLVDAYKQPAVNVDPFLETTYTSLDDIYLPANGGSDGDIIVPDRNKVLKFNFETLEEPETICELAEEDLGGCDNYI